MEIANHTFFITGAGSGLGRATALRLAKHQANVVIADVNADSGKSFPSDLIGQIYFVKTDVTKTASIENALSKAKKHFGNIHGLINCAGILVAERMLRKDGNLFNPDAFRLCIDVNLIGTFNMIRLACPILVNNPPNHEGERGIIINTASVAAYEGQIGQAGYAASKAGIIGMTLPIARELGKSGIRVMAIAPGVFATPLFADIKEDKRKELEQRIPFPSRLGKPDEFAALVQHIIENPMLNGDVIRLDGALRM